MLKKIKNYGLILIFGLALGLGLITTPARAVLQLDITKGVTKPMAMAILPLVGSNGPEADAAAIISEVIVSDLTNCGLFRAIDKNAFIQSAKELGTNPRFADWQAIGAEALVAGKVLLVGNRLTVEFRLWDVLGKQVIEGQVINGSQESARRIGHKISDFIYSRITGDRGYFDSQIVFVRESGPFNKRIKQIAIMDQDGANPKVLSDPRVLTLTPRFSINNRVITYMSYYNNRPRVYIFDLQTGEQTAVGDFPGMTFAPRFSPTGNQVIMSLATDGHSDIYSLDLKSREVRRIPRNSSGAIDTSPSYAPDGARIVFNSDRGGTQQLYTMNSDGSNVRRISFGQGIYATPVWSPRGDLIAFTKIHAGRFHIGVMRPDGSGERLLTDAFLDEGPSWSPNGRVLVFFRQTPSDNSDRAATSKLMSVDITGTVVREYKLPFDASDPAWSPLLP
ncbi:MAG: Tol-Pal system beta propeller repeat protein TolB [Candidatus Pacebacteria bacterium]|nr:Tol-Pal system beta propeller repeat protein TolB [Candidatus Paceibacterota bacterium]